MGGARPCAPGCTCARHSHSEEHRRKIAEGVRRAVAEGRRKSGRPPCSVEGCDRPSDAHGLCSTHRKRMAAFGSTDKPSRKGVNAAENNPAWKGDAASVQSGRERAVRRFALGICEYEGCNAQAVDRHHKDGNTRNNDHSNVALLCRRHHMTVDGRLDALTARNRSQVDA